MRGRISSHRGAGPAREGGSRAFLFAALAAAVTTLGLMAGCSIVATRPVQEMSDTQASLRAAREVQADTLSPELYRQATELYFKAKNEYKFKNFELARRY